MADEHPGGLDDSDEWNADGAFPMVDELPIEQREALMALTVDALDVQSYRIFEDDVIVVNAVINGISVSLWWGGIELCGAFMYDQDPRAKAAIIAGLKADFTAQCDQDQRDKAVIVDIQTSIGH